MTDGSHYIISGGAPGAERLRVLSLAMRSASLALLDRAGLSPGLEVLDLGCGGGDMTVDIARLVGPTGRVVGIDMDNRVLAHARSEQQLGRGGGQPLEQLREQLRGQLSGREGGRHRPRVPSREPVQLSGRARSCARRRATGLPRPWPPPPSRSRAPR